MINPLVMDTQVFVQSILNLRSSALPASEEMIQRIKNIDPLLYESDAAPNWRRGDVGGNRVMNRRSPTTITPSNRWKNSNTSIDSLVSNESQQQSPHVKYESRFKNTDSPVEDTILNKIILNKLNKFSGNTYNEIRDFLYQVLDSGENEFTKEFMKLVFKKAAAEEIFCPLYARLLKELRTTYPIIQSEMIELFASYNGIFQDMSSLSESDYKAFVERNIEKKYRLGYSQFLAELVMLEAVDLKSLEKTFKVLIDNIATMGTEGRTEERADKISEIQEYADCLLRMTRVIPVQLKKVSAPFFVNLRAVLLEVLRQHLDDILVNKKNMFPAISPKARFALMDVRDNLQATKI